MENHNHIGNNNGNGDENDLIGNIDLDKIYHVLKRSIPWMLLLMLITNSIAYVYVRYTQPIFQSDSILKLDIKSEASLLGVQDKITPDIKGLSGEMELLKSRLFFGQVVDAVGMDVSYYHPGRSHFLSQIVDERYNNCPFVVSHKIKNGGYFNRKFDLEILDDENYKLSYESGNQTISENHKFGEPISNENFNFLIEKTPNFKTGSNERDYYFTINSRDALINYFVSNVTVKPENFNANTIRISMKHHNRHKVRDLIHAIDTLYLDYTKQAKNKTIEQKIAFLDAQLLKTTKELEEYEEYFEKFTIENRTTDLSKDINQTIVLLNALDSQRYKLRSALSSINVISREMEKGEPLSVNLLMTANLPGYIRQSVSAYSELAKEKELKLASYKENTFVVKRIDQRLQVAMKNAKQQISMYQNTLVDNLEDIKNRREILERNFEELPSMGTSYNKNKRFYTLQEGYYLSIIKSKMELEIARAGTVTNFVILSPASLPFTPVEPQRLLIYGIGFVTGLILSILFVAIRYLLHNKISSHKELERLINIPVLGMIPHYRKEKLDITQLVVDKNPKSAISEAIRSIRTNMDFLVSAKKKKVISITSTVSGEGKTFIAVNLGAILALSKNKIVVVDLDMRKPKVHLAFNEEKGEAGVSTILIDKHTVDEAVSPTRIENLFYVTAGPTPPNPSELILSDKFEVFLQELQNKFDVIILDTPPVGLVTDGILAMKHSDLPIYVMRADYSKKAYAKSINSLATNNKFKNLTAIMNSVKSNKNQGYGYGYGYGYGHGDGYYEEDSANNGTSKLGKLLFNK
ncbi:MAG: polysaccharide biosynthesis tyrosine autokinase [Cyclobacteriaceae bacterium]